MAKIPVFISYHGSDLDLASKLRKSLKRLSSDFDVFLDKYSIRPSEDYEQKIADEIAKAEWFLIVCTGFPHRDADMLWSFFEAGQFRATLPDTLSGVSGRRIVCLFDTEPPTVLSRFHGVKVEPRQLNGSPVDVDARAASANEQLDATAIRGLLEDMLTNAPLEALRDMADDSTRDMLREEAYNLIKAFEVTDPGKRIDEKTLQPRISFELFPGESLTAGIQVKGYEQSLRTLFGIESSEATWGRISSESQEDKVKPVWICDVETAAALIMRDRTPDLHANKCILRETVYTVFVARYEIFKNRKRVIYVAFLPASKKNFDMTRRSSMILSALILTTRFREQVIPQGARIADPTDIAGTLLSFYRNLVAIEIEAKQFGLDVETPVEDEPPLLASLHDDDNRVEIQAGIEAWRCDRQEIETMFSDEASLQVDGVRHAERIRNMMEAVRPTNERFIEILTEEMRSLAREGKP